MAMTMLMSILMRPHLLTPPHRDRTLPYNMGKVYSRKRLNKIPSEMLFPPILFENSVMFLRAVLRL
jgi:hypothetical protein